MASRTYKARALVLRKTRLGEKDLIVHMADEDGSLVKGVAKGARKPGGSLAARLELFSAVDVLMAHGRSLDVVCEARLVDAAAVPRGLVQSACAAPVAELLCHIVQPDLPQPRLHDMARAAFARIATLPEGDADALSVCAATLWKVMSQSGFRPSFTACVSCGRPVGSGGRVAVSVADGGVVCDACPRPADALMVDDATIRLCDLLVRSRFDDIVAAELPVAASFECLHLARTWIRAHAGRDLKSLDFLFTGGLF